LEGTYCLYFQSIRTGPQIIGVGFPVSATHPSDYTVSHPWGILIFVFTVFRVYIYCRHYLHLLSSEFKFTVVSAYIYCRQSLNLLSSVLTFTVVITYIYCRQSLHLLSSVLLHTVVRAYTYCRHYLHLLSSELAFTVVSTYIYCHQNLHFLSYETCDYISLFKFNDICSNALKNSDSIHFT